MNAKEKSSILIFFISKSKLSSNGKRFLFKIIKNKLIVEKIKRKFYGLYRKKKTNSIELALKCMTYSIKTGQNKTDLQSIKRNVFFLFKKFFHTEIS